MTRYLLVLPGAVLLVLALMWAMGQLIRTDQNQSLSTESYRAIEFMRAPMSESPPPPDIAPPEPVLSKEVSETPPPPSLPNLVMPTPAPLPDLARPVLKVPDLRLPQVNIMGDLQQEIVETPLAVPVAPRPEPAPVAPAMPQVAPTFSDELYPVHNPAPLYPAKARRRNITGWVRVAFTITEEGRVDNVTVVSADPEGFFEQATIRAVRQWQFQPQLLGEGNRSRGGAGGTV